MSHTPHLIMYTQPTALQTLLMKIPGENGPAKLIAGHVLHLLFLHRTSIANKKDILGSSKWGKKKKKKPNEITVINIKGINSNSNRKIIGVVKEEPYKDMSENSIIIYSVG